MSAPSTNMTAKLSKYAKMQTMFPECVIRQKMSVDGFTTSEIDSFLGSAPEMPVPTNHTSTSPTAKLGKYTKMRAILPENAVRQHMAADGFSPEMCDKFFASAPSETGTIVVDTIRVTDVHFKKYMKMKSLFPECVLRQKMSVDGFFSSEIDAFLINGPLTGSTPPLCRPVSATRLVKYAKMKAMLPEGAVRQKMTVDGCSPTSIDTFFASEPASSSAGPMTKALFSASHAANQRSAKYAKMQKLLPEGAVRQRMLADGINSAAIDAFFTANLGTNLQSLVLTPRVDANRLAKYVTMLKVFPEVVVRQRMVADGFEAGFIDHFLATTTSTAMDICVPTVNTRYARYVKMAAMFPIEVVRQKMTVDGFTVTEIAYFLAYGTPLQEFHVPGKAKSVPMKQRAKYVKMRSMLPDGAVRQKMCVDGWASETIDAFFVNTPTPNRDYRGSGRNRTKRGREEGEEGSGYMDGDKRFRALGAALF